MTSKELAEIFEEIEIKLIASLKRNLEKHKQWEKKLDFDWTAWQALKIKSLERFRKDNADVLSEYTDIISAETRKMLEEQFDEGEMLEFEQLQENGFNETTNDNFFEIFDEKIESLIEEIQGKEITAEKAAIRMMDDVYRQALIKAETAVATGSQTIQQALEETVKEFAQKGINCIEYRDGRRVNIADYIYMALRTANTRAGLLGAAKQRMALGIDTVRVSSYNLCSETCLPWQGGVYIDDVFATFDGEISGHKGKSNNGNWYTLLSVAVRAGLFHPNCRHSLTTYTLDSRESPVIDETKARENSKLEKRQRAMERRVRYWKRRLEAESDPELKKGLKNQLDKARKTLNDFVDEHKDILRRDPWRERTYTLKSDSHRNAKEENKPLDEAFVKELGYISESERDTKIQEFINEFVFGDDNVTQYEHMLVIADNGQSYYITNYSHDSICNYNLEKEIKNSYNIHTHPKEYTQYTFSVDSDIPSFFNDGSAVMEACDYKYRYRFERPENITLDEWEKAKYKAKTNVLEIMDEGEFSFDDYEENYNHLIISETCRILGIDVYKRWKL